MLFLASEFDVQVVLGLGAPENVNIFDVFCSNYRTGKMSCIPMGAYAAFKVRDNLNGSSEKNERTFGSFQAKSMPTNDVQTNQQVQYNGKFMNAIWGAYNRYSVHNMKSHVAFDKA